MKSKTAIVYLAALLCVKPTFAVIPVTVDAIVDVNYLFNQAQQLLNLAATAKQTFDLYNEAKRLNDFMGDPKKGLSAMIDYRPLMDDINAQLAGGTSYLSGVPGLDATQNFLHDLNGGIQLNLRLLPADSAMAAADDERIADGRRVQNPDGTYTAPDAKLYQQLDEAEAIARSVKAAVVAQNKAREQAGKTLAKITDAMSKATTESEKQALGSQYNALAAQMAMLNGQLQQQQFEYQLQRDRDQRLADNANLTDQQQAVTDANAATAASDAQATRAQQNAAAARTTVNGMPIDLDYSQIK